MSMSDRQTADQILKTIMDWEQATTTNDIDNIVVRLAAIGELAIPAVLEHVQALPPRKPRRRTAMKVFQAMGYPTNAQAIPFLVEVAGDTNSPGWEIALEVLKDIGSPAVPVIRDALRSYIDHPDWPYPDIQGLCILLRNMGSPTIDPALPELLQLLRVGTDESHVDEYALWPIRAIGSPKAYAAIPLIIDKIRGEGSEHIRRLAVEALTDFEPLAVRPFATVLRRCLSDQSQGVRDSARMVLDMLGEE